MFSQELTLNSCKIEVAGATVNLTKTTKTEKKSEDKLYALGAVDAADAAAWADALRKSAAAADEQGLGTGERSKAKIFFVCVCLV